MYKGKANKLSLKNIGNKISIGASQLEILQPAL